MLLRRTIRFTAIILLFSVAIIFINITESHAAKFGGQLINGPRNMAYTVNGAAAAYTGNINNASYNWMYTGYDNPIYLIPVSSTDGSTVDYYATYYYDNTIAVTNFFNSYNAQQSPYYNYLYCKIYFNDKFKYDTSINHDGVTAHELGHVLGLAHSNSNPYSIMCQTKYGRIVQKPQKIDNDEIVSMYGSY